MNNQWFLKKGGHFGTLKISVFIEIDFRLKSAIFSTCMESTDGSHKFPVSRGTGKKACCFRSVLVVN